MEQCGGEPAVVKIVPELLMTVLLLQQADVVLVLLCGQVDSVGVLQS